MSNKQKAVSGGKWITLSTGVSIGVQFAQVAMLARLLDPADFGVVAISNLIIGFFVTFANLGFANSIIYKQESDRTVLSTLYWLNMLVGATIFLIIQFSTPAIVQFYKEPKLTQVLHLSSFYFLIVYVGQLYMFLLEKELRFREVATVEIGGTVLGAVVTVVLAFSGFAELSLIVGQLVSQTVKSTLQVWLGRSLFWPALRFQVTQIREHLQFGVFNLANGILGYVQSNADNFFIGSILGVKMLGYYQLAYQLSVFPIIRLNPIILQVAFPILAKMQQDNEGLKRAYLKILDALSFTNLPLLAGLFITAQSVVPLFYGPGWDESARLVQIFVFVGLFSCLGHPLFTLAYTKGKPDLLFYLNAASLVVKIPLVYILGHRYGVNGVAAAFVVTTIFDLTGNFLIVHSLVGDFLGQFLRNFVQPLVFALIMVAVILVYQRLIGAEGLLHTLVQVAIGGTVFIGLTLAFKMSLAEIKALRTVGA
jgi:lipopolysaccharide exporter